MNPLENNEELDRPTKCAVKDKSTGKRFPLVPIYLYYEPEVEKHVWALALHPDVDGDVVISVEHLEFQFEIDNETTAVAIQAQRTDDPQALRIIRHAEMTS